MFLQEVSISQASEAFALIDDQFTIQECTQKWNTLFSHHNEPFSNLKDLLALSSDQGEYFFDCIHRIKNTGVVEQCYTLFNWSAEEHDWISWEIKKSSGEGCFFLYAAFVTEEVNHRRFFEESDDLLMSIDSNDYIRHLNPGGFDLLGYTPAEMIGQPLAKFIFPDDHKKTEDIIQVLETSQKIEGFINRYICKDGSIKWIKWSAHSDANTGFTFGIGRDITEVVSNKIDLQEGHAMLNALAYIQELYISGMDIRRLFDEILKKLLELSSSGYGFIGNILKNEKGKPYLKTYAISDIAWNKETKQLYNEKLKTGMEFHNLDSLFGYTIRTGEMLIANDPKNNPYSGGLPEGHPNLNTYLGFPVHGANGFIGMLGIANRPEGYSEEVVEKIKPLVKVIASIIEAHYNAEAVEKLAHHDFLTQLYNRAYFDKQLQKEIDMAKNTGTQFALMYLDLDKFKEVNDKFGHKIGDMLLFNVARRLKHTFRSSDILARLGGDEFGVLIPEINNTTDIEVLTKKIINKITKSFFVAGHHINVGLSIGVAVFPASAKTADLLYKCADKALYQAKHSKVSCMFYSEEVEASHNKKLLIESGIEQAIKNEELFLEFQPQYDLRENKIIGVEFLLRWNHPVLGRLLPDEFIPVLEEGRKMGELNLYVIQKSDAVVRSLCGCSARTGFLVCINISLKMLDFNENLRQIRAFLENACLLNPCFGVEFELTETAIVQNESVVEILQAYTDAGVRIAIDDFGVAHSSLHRLSTLPIKTLKLDMSFVKTVGHDEKTQIIVKSVIDLAKNLGIRVVAEGLETEIQKTVLVALGCRYVQGYYFSEPLSLEALKAKLAQA